MHLPNIHMQSTSHFPGTFKINGHPIVCLHCYVANNWWLLIISYTATAASNTTDALIRIELNVVNIKLKKEFDIEFSTWLDWDIEDERVEKLKCYAWEQDCWKVATDGVRFYPDQQNERSCWYWSTITMQWNCFAINDICAAEIHGHNRVVH